MHTMEYGSLPSKGLRLRDVNRETAASTADPPDRDGCAVVVRYENTQKERASCLLLPSPNKEWPDYKGIPPPFLRAAASALSFFEFQTPRQVRRIASDHNEPPLSAFTCVERCVGSQQRLAFVCSRATVNARVVPRPPPPRETRKKNCEFLRGNLSALSVTHQHYYHRTCFAAAPTWV